MDFNPNIIEELDGAIMDAMTDGLNDTTKKVLHDAVDDTLTCFFNGVKENAQEMAKMAIKGREFLDQAYVEQDFI